MRVQLIQKTHSITCLLFDCEPGDLRNIADLMVNTTADIDWRNPLAFLTLLIQSIGKTSEEKRSLLDIVIFNTELETGSTSWGDKSNLVVRWPQDSYKTMSAVHICHNNLVFVARAVEFEADLWTKLRTMAQADDWKSVLTPKDDENGRAGGLILGTIEVELAYTESRLAQIRGLEKRAEVQINLVSQRNTGIYH